MTDNADLYTTADRAIGQYQALAKLLTPMLSHAMNRGFFLMPEEYEVIHEAISQTIQVIEPMTDLTTVKLKREHIIAYHITDDLYYIELSIPLYLRLMATIDPEIFPTPDTVTDYGNFLKETLEMEEQAFIYFLHGLKESQRDFRQPLAVGVLSIGELSQQTFTLDHKAYPLVTHTLIPALYSIGSPHIALYHTKKKYYESVDVMHRRIPNQFIQDYVMIDDTETIGYVQLKYVP